MLPSVGAAARRTLPPLAVGAVLAAGALWFAIESEVIYDTDSYYHLAIARIYATAGQVDSLPWLRASLLGELFGDKELLFHWLLAPFAAFERPELGGRVALAILVGALGAALAALGQGAVGAWGLALPFLVLLGSIATLDRVIRLRPELLSLLLLLAAAVCAIRQRYRLLGLVALVYALSYTAFQALLLLCAGWWLIEGLRHRRWRWPLLLYPTTGAGLGLLLHPDLPDNLLIWKVQNVDFFRMRGVLDVGTEIAPASTREMLSDNLGWLAGMLLLMASAEGTGERAGARPRDVFAVAAVLFGLLYVRMQRFSIYAIPFATLAIAFELRRRGSTPSARARLPRGRSVPAWPLLLVVTVVSLAPSLRQLHAMATATGGELEREEDWRRLARAIPEGAQIAADWGITPPFLLWGLHAGYLNALDPIFFAIPHPDAYRDWRSIVEGTEPDVAGTLRGSLASEGILLSPIHTRPELLTRLENDPRLVAFYRGYTMGYHLVAPAQTRDLFAGDWRIVGPPGPDRLDWSTGYVTLEPTPEHCLTVIGELDPEAGDEVWELAPWGPATVRIDGGDAVSVPATSAILGLGARIEPKGGATVEVETCPAGDPPRWGFYLVRR